MRDGGAARASLRGRALAAALLLPLLGLPLAAQAILDPPLTKAPGREEGGGPLRPGSSFEGRASWSGGESQGLITASGEAFDKEGLTAAHRTLPFGTLLRVTARSSGASVVVRVIDRGPFVADRVIDLSEAAARLIGLVAEGTGWVSCLVLPPEEEVAFGSPEAAAPSRDREATKDQPAARMRRIQVESYRDATGATATLERLRLSGILATLERSGREFRVVLPAVPEYEVAALVDRLAALGYRRLVLSWPP